MNMLAKPLVSATCPEESAHPELWEGLDSITDFCSGTRTTRDADGKFAVEDISGHGHHGILKGFEK